MFALNNTDEIYKEFETVIDDNPDEGSVFGYISNNDDNFLNFLEKNDYYEDDFNSLDEYKNCSKGYICNMYVEEEYRGEGSGTLLMDYIITDLTYDNDLKYIFLVCDNIQSNNFSLQKWYESYGFKVIADKFNCPLMVMSVDENKIKNKHTKKDDRF